MVAADMKRSVIAVAEGENSGSERGVADKSKEQDV